LLYAEPLEQLFKKSIDMKTQPLNDLFPDAHSIPPQYQIPEQIQQREYLVDGVLHVWDGALAQVSSPIFVKDGDSREQVILGSTPLGFGGWSTTAFLRNEKLVKAQKGIALPEKLMLC
jgi:hypothetical protein